MMNEVKNSDVRVIEDENKCRNRKNEEQDEEKDKKERRDKGGEEERKRRRIDRGKGV